MIYGMKCEDVSYVLLKDEPDGWRSADDFKLTHECDFATWMVLSENGRFKMKICCPVSSVLAVRGGGAID